MADDQTVSQGLSVAIRNALAEVDAMISQLQTGQGPITQEQLSVHRASVAGISGVADALAGGVVAPVDVAIPPVQPTTPPTDTIPPIEPPPIQPPVIP